MYDLGQSGAWSLGQCGVEAWTEWDNCLGQSGMCSLGQCGITVLDRVGHGVLDRVG